MLVEAYRRAEPPYDAGPVAAEAGATSMIDVSDGLLADARHLAEESGVAIDVRRDAFEVPEPLHAVGAATGVDPVSLILGGGEDHALLATFPTADVPAGWTVIGSVAEGVGRHRRRRRVRRPHAGGRTSEAPSRHKETPQTEGRMRPAYRGVSCADSARVSG